MQIEILKIEKSDEWIPQELTQKRKIAMGYKFRISSISRITLILLMISVSHLFADESGRSDLSEDELEFIVFWEGTKPLMYVDELAAYCAPIFWFSPDEPELKEKEGKDIRIPAAFPFDEQVDSPVVYYQIRDILATSDSGAFRRNPDNIGKSILDLSQLAGLNIDYNHYYKFEVGLGKHNHDTEQCQFKIYVHTYQDSLKMTHYQLYLIQTTAKAHALSWYDNIYKVNKDNLNTELEIPFHIMVEEGKHASVSDMNGDGYYTPGYDVNVRTNDAWGLRDVIRTGELFSSQFMAWMAKVRTPQYRVFPPLPPNSPQRKKYERNGVYAPDNAIYELRPMPAPEKALPDQVLAKDMSGYYTSGWPEVNKVTSVDKFFDWWEAENFIHSLGIAARVDNSQWGISFSFPLLIVKNVEAPLVGGWVVNRIYLQDKHWRDFGWNLLYTPSASRFLDPYFSLGFEQDKYDVEEDGMTTIKKRMDFVFETGIKLRGNVKYSPLKFLTVLADLWGVRFGIKNRGFMRIDELTYVFEIGAGVW
jgi:hypothetical protein